MIKLKDILLNEADVFGNTSNTSSGGDQIEKELEKEMGASLKDLEAATKSIAPKAKAEVDAVDEGKLNESLGVTAIIGIILAAPKVVEIFAKGLSKLIKAFQRLLGKDQTGSKVAETIIDFAHKWHKLYIKAVRGILWFTGIFRKAKITDKKDQQKAAEAVYYIIVAGLAVSAGIGAVGAFKGAMSTAAHGGSFSLGALETAMAAIKTGEVATFVKSIGVAA
tara:strand:- start:318 stop:983 length:666 start_codon:yes stop_codon:yes gene_type:complete